MTDQTGTITQAVAVRDNGPLALVDRYRSDLALVMPSHINAKAWTRLAIGALRRDGKLMEAAQNDTGAFLTALLDAAQKGLTPGTEEYYLVPRRKKRGAPLTVQGTPGYQGIVEMMYRAGAVSSVIVEVVREKDDFVWKPGRYDDQQPPRWQGPQVQPYHDVDWFADRGPLLGVYAYGVMRDGGAISKVVVLNRDDIRATRAKSDSAHSDYSPWNTNEQAMWLKSAVRQLRKWVPTSAEYIRERLRAQAEINAEQDTAPMLPSSFPAPVPGAVEDDDYDDAPVDGELVD